MIRILKRGILLRMCRLLAVSAISNEYEEAFEWWRAGIEPKVAVGDPSFRMSHLFGHLCLQQRPRLVLWVRR